jgi:hypothetical protein
MTLADMRKELKDMRKKAMPTPVSRMKKGDVAAELERLRGKEEVAVKAVMKAEEVPKKTVKKVEAVHKVAHKEQEESLKKTIGVKRKASPPPAKKAKVESADKPAKGSEEMRARMAKLREMRKAKKEEA